MCVGLPSLALFRVQVREVNLRLSLNARSEWQRRSLSSLPRASY